MSQESRPDKDREVLPPYPEADQLAFNMQQRSLNRQRQEMRALVTGNYKIGPKDDDFYYLPVEGLIGAAVITERDSFIFSSEGTNSAETVTALAIRPFRQAVSVARLTTDGEPRAVTILNYEAIDLSYKAKTSIESSI